MKTIAELEAVDAAARNAHQKAQNRIARLDRILAAMTFIDDALGDCPDLTVADRVALDKVNNAAAFVALSANRKALRVEIDRLETECHRTAHALNDAPEEAA